MMYFARLSFTIVFCASLITGTTMAQSRFLVEVGPTYSTDLDSSGASKWSVGGGIGLERQLSETFYLQPEIYVVSDIAPVYLMLPMMGKYKLETGGVLRPFVIAGPELGIRIAGGGVTAMKPVQFSLCMVRTCR